MASLQLQYAAFLAMTRYGSQPTRSLELDYRSFLLVQAGTSGLQIAPLPYDLAEAIVARFAANAGPLAGITRIYELQAGDRAVLPYLVYQISEGPSLLTTDVHYIFDQRVRLSIYAATQAQANNLRDAVHASFGAGSYDFQIGFSIPFFQTNRREGKEPQRGPNLTYVFKATLEYSARTHRS